MSAKIASLPFDTSCTALSQPSRLWRALAAVSLAVSLTACGGGGSSSDTSANPLDQSLTASIQSLGGAQQWTLPDGTDLSAIPQDARNPLTAEKVALGKLLYHDPALGTQPKVAANSGTYSCASCHNDRFGFQAGIRQGLGEGGESLLARHLSASMASTDADTQPLRSPSAMNVAWQRNVLWNGQFGAKALNVGTEDRWTAGTPKEKNLLGYDGLEIQAIAGQGVHRLGAIPAVYKPMFDAAFADWTVDKRYGTEAAGLAIAAFERTMVANQAPWQKWLRGDTTAMTDQQKRGALLFLGKAQCVSCHSGPALSSETFHALGLSDMVGINVTQTQAEHLGRGGFTGKAEDNYKFKTPQLYNLSDSPFYGHGGSVSSLRAMVVYKNQAMAENSRVPTAQLAPQFKPLGLTDAEIDDLTEFLSGALHDPNLARYRPDTVPSGACVIDDDNVARQEMGFPAR